MYINIYLFAANTILYARDNLALLFYLLINVFNIIINSFNHCLVGYLLPTIDISKCSALELPCFYFSIRIDERHLQSDISKFLRD